VKGQECKLDRFANRIRELVNQKFIFVLCLAFSNEISQKLVSTDGGKEKYQHTLTLWLHQNELAQFQSAGNF
jgi:hypothetical protein